MLVMKRVVQERLQADLTAQNGPQLANADQNLKPVPGPADRGVSVEPIAPFPKER